MRNVSAVCIVSAFLLMLLISAPVCAQDTDTLVIIHTNDIHGRIAENIGYESFAAYVNETRNEYADVLVLDAGDTLEDTPEVDLNEGASVVRIMNIIGYDAMTLGNHEFGYTPDVLLKRVSEINFPVVSSNIYDNTGKQVFSDAIVIEKGKWKAGIFGLTAPDTPRKSSHGNEFTFKSGDELIKIAENQVKYLKDAGCDVIICLAHLGLDAGDAPDRSCDIAESVEGIDIIVDGHSHTVLPDGLKSGDTIIASTGSFFENIGRIEVTPDKKITASLISNYTGEFPQVKEICDECEDEVEKNLMKVIGVSEVYLDGVRETIRRSETNLGDLVADSLFASGISAGFSPDAALLSSGSIRDSLNQGNITLKDINTVYPYVNYITCITVPGSVLLSALEDNADLLPEPSGGFPQVSGIIWSVDTDEPYVKGEVHRVKIESVGGMPFDPSAEYTIAATDFVAEGGDKYAPFAAYTPKKSTITITESLVSYIEGNLNGIIGQEYAMPDGRLTIIGAGQAQSPAQTETNTAAAVLPAGLFAVLSAGFLMMRRQ